MNLDPGDHVIADGLLEENQAVLGLIFLVSLLLSDETNTKYFKSCLLLYYFAAK